MAEYNPKSSLVEDLQTTTRAQLIQIAQELLQRPIAFHRSFARIGGGVTAGLMLSQAWYWSQRTKNVEKWFYKTQEQWESETGLTRREQETARRNLKERGLIEEKLAGVPARLHFRVNVETLFDALLKAADTENLAKMPVQSSLAETCKLDGAKRTGKFGGNVQSISETKSETTTKNTHTEQRAARGVGVGSKFSLEDCRRYAEHLRASGEGITNPGGFAQSIYRTGDADASIERFLGGDLSENSSVVAFQCPDCNEAGFTHESILSRTVVKCKHPKLSERAQGASAA
jgi:hypothetical protein